MSTRSSSSYYASNQPDPIADSPTQRAAVEARRLAAARDDYETALTNPRRSAEVYYKSADAPAVPVAPIAPDTAPVTPPPLTPPIAPEDGPLVPPPADTVPLTRDDATAETSDEPAADEAAAEDAEVDDLTA